jgi:hypothetical protein
MNPEEFDRRLRKSFNKENLPPREDLWENIASKIETKPKRGFWFFTIPVLASIFLFSMIAFIFNSKDNNHQANVNQNYTAKAEEKKVINNENEAPVVTTDINTSLKSNDNQANKEELKLQEIKKLNSSIDLSIVNKEKTISSSSKPSFLNKFSNQLLTQTENNNDWISNFDQTIFSLSKINYRKTSFFPQFFREFLPNEQVSKPSHNQSNHSNNDSKWSLIFGVGPQLAVNKINLPNQQKDFVHKDLWNNKNQLTNNGTGFQSHLNLNYKINKYFNFETGLNYGLRTEDIKLDVSSFDIAARNSNKKILLYNKILLLVIVINPDGSTDSTFYDAVSSFNLAVNNKYQSLTIPININSEFMISENTGFNIGIGGGLSYLFSTKSTHFDIINEKKVETKKQSMLTSSLNSKITMFTNFNDIGRIGLYFGFQVYTQPWQVAKKQYSIGMRDLQMGMMFQKPLNW